ncbi:RhoGAP-domain-containing protein [Mollisia scopiformis]|uniref:RhoGAP-domain-containing protein n=1 Tax=Mollisia scopiformis TaxID=149040 RepID=A0A194WTX0_MOLSC|nr:RhoGAP-domain-containing protein [Mollisia scopiformis]KUJ11057.1 RhoGAP-domain-containing protein [Mollisia scopiformis]
MGPQSEGGPSGDGRNFGGQYTAYDPAREAVKDYNGHDEGRRYQSERNVEQDTTLARPNAFGMENRMTASPSGSASGRERDRDGQPPKTSGERNRSRTRNGRTASGTLRICKKCGEPLTGQFVRALGGTFHLDCFRCRDCGEIVASKFFPVDEENGEGQYPLCETDYFRRLDLICQKCKGALRGSYITALDKKYHIDHFTCSVCPTVFGAQDSYYEHDGQVYCHFHYSTQFAQRCNGCQTAILKQFVEIFRNGQNQHWHPECYMIHKFWNVRLASSQERPENARLLEDVTDEEGRNAVRLEEERMEDKVYRIWSVLSTFEESSAACISDMLLHVSNGAYVDGVLTAKKFILHVDILFRSADKLDATMAKLGPKGLSYAREAKLLCKKIVAFFALLSKTQESGVRKLGVTQELLALVTGLAHYLKLLIRICLQGALKVEREQHTSDCLHVFLDDLGDMELIKNDDRSLEATTGTPSLGAPNSDDCVTCRRDIEDECARSGERRWHRSCLQCTNCARELGQNLEDARWSNQDQRVYCNNCEGRAPGSIGGFERVTKLQQYVFLLRVALARLLDMLRNSGALPHTSDDPNLNGYNSSEGYRLPADADPPLLRSDTRSKSFGGNADENRNSSTYESALNDVRRLRSTRMDRHLSSNIKKARTSRILDGPEGRSARPGSSGADGSDSRDPGFKIVEERDGNGEARTQLMFGREDGITLDDIPRIMATHQAKEQRPNAYKHARDPFRNSMGAEAKLINGHQRNISSGNDLDQATGEPSPQKREGKKYFSELSALEYFIVRHVAVITMQPMLEGHFTMEELLNLIESRKPANFWNKMGKAFKGNDGKKGGKKKGVFGVPLDVIIDRDGADSTDGIGPGALRIPAIVDDIVTTMRKMDLSVEGVFRKNGNIKRLNDSIAIIDKEGCDAVDFTKENVVQIAALLKKYLRELPDPLLTFKLHRLFIASQKIADEDKRRRVLHLTCCLLPKAHRDCLEILCSFFNWVASFHQVDEESGSKMDTHNLATVIAPNILYTNAKGPVDDNFLGIEVVHTLIECNEQMCEVPEDLQSILGDQTLFNNPSDITTKEILKRYGDLGMNGGPRHEVQTTELPHRSKDGSGRALAPQVTRVDTDPSQAYAWQKEASVRHVQEPSAPYGGPSNNSQQQWQGQDLEQPAPYVHRNGTPDSQKDARREYRNSGWRPQNGSVGVTGAG